MSVAIAPLFAANTTTLPSIPSDDAGAAFLTYADVAARTGLSISSIRRLAARHEFPSPIMRMPRRPAFPVAAVEQWIRAKAAGGAR